MKWKRVVLTSIIIIVILVQSMVIFDYHFRLKASRENTDAWFDVATQWHVLSEDWELRARKLAAINHACLNKLQQYQEFATQLFDPRLQNETPLRPLDLIEAPKK